MNQKRRRACDFTNSLSSFRSTMGSQGSFEPDSLQTFTEDSLNENSIRDSLVDSHFRNENMRNVESNYMDKHSSILAGSSMSTDSFMSRSATSESCKVLQLKPDLNKRMDLLSIDNLSDYTGSNVNTTSCGHELNRNYNKENENPQCPYKRLTSRQGEVYTFSNGTSPLGRKEDKMKGLAQKRLINEATTEDSSRDTNYNIQCSAQTTGHLSEQYLQNSTKPEQECHNFESLLCSLDNHLNEVKEASHPKQMFKRLSNNFSNCPKNFTEKLLTIIEESIIHDNDSRHDTSAVNLSRLTIEFRKMCKFIEDETIPEWPPSPDFLSPDWNQRNTSPSLEVKREKRNSIHGTSFYKDQFKPCRKLFHRISKHTLSPSMNSINLSTNECNDDSFLRLEAQCNRLFKNESELYQTIHKAVSMPSLMSMDSIYKLCEQQMASLDDTDNVNMLNKNSGNKDSVFTTSKSSNATPIVSNVHKFQGLYHNEFISPLRRDSQSKLKNSSPDCVQRFANKRNSFGLKSECKKFVPINIDELEETLRHDIAEQRNRCLDTAKLLMEISADSPIEQTQDHDPPVTNDESTFLNTLISCKNYHTFLRKRKPLFNFFGSEVSMVETSPSRTPKKQYSTPTSTSRSAHETPRTKTSAKKTDEQARYQRPKLFVTPGKSPSNKPCRKKQILFPDMRNEIKKTPEHILESPNAKGLYRLNYNTIISPVGMYIRGTDPQQLKNTKREANTPLLDCKIQKLRQSPIQKSSPHSIRKTQTKSYIPSLRLYSTPKSNDHAGPKKKMERATSENVIYSPHPKAFYRSPHQVHSTKEKEVRSSKPHTKTLVHSTQSGTMNRDQGSINRTKVRAEKEAERNRVYEINYHSQGSSTHNEQPASRTNYFKEYEHA